MRYSETGRVKIEAEVEVMLATGQEHQEPPEAGRGKEGFSPPAPQGIIALPTP